VRRSRGEANSAGSPAIGSAIDDAVGLHLTELPLTLEANVPRGRAKKVGGIPSGLCAGMSLPFAQPLPYPLTMRMRRARQ